MTTALQPAIANAEAFKRDLSAAGILRPDREADAVRSRLDAWRPSVAPADPLEEWLFTQAVVCSVRVDACASREVGMRHYLARRAGLCWDDDRRLAAEELAARLGKKPALVARKLAATRQGALWMTERWEELAARLREGGAWGEDQRTLALDLLGTPAEFREGWEALGAEPGSPEALALAGRELARLRGRLEEALEALDAREQAAAEMGLELELPRPLSLLRRYEAACLRRFQWARKQLAEKRRAGPPPAPAGAPVAAEVALAAAESPRMTAEEYAAYDAGLFRKLMDKLRDDYEQAAESEAEPAAPAPAPAVAAEPPSRPREAAAAPARHTNRRMRRAAERKAARDR